MANNALAHIQITHKKRTTRHSTSSRDIDVFYSVQKLCITLNLHFSNLPQNLTRHNQAQNIYHYGSRHDNRRNLQNLKDEQQEQYGECQYIEIQLDGLSNKVINMIFAIPIVCRV